MGGIFHWSKDAAAFRYIWAEMENHFRQYGRDRYLPTDFDPGPFIDRLRSLSAWQSMAVLDAIERYYALVVGKYPGEIPIRITDCDLLFAVGLILEPKVSEPVRWRGPGASPLGVKSIHHDPDEPAVGQPAPEKTKQGKR